MNVRVHMGMLREILKSIAPKFDRSSFHPVSRPLAERKHRKRRLVNSLCWRSWRAPCGQARSFVSAPTSAMMPHNA